MATKDIIVQQKTPSTGSDTNNTSNVYNNIKIDENGVIYIPVGDVNTLNGGKDRDGAIKLTQGLLNTYADGIWTEYIPVLDGLKEIGAITVAGLNITVAPLVRWRINSVNYEKSTSTIIPVDPTTTGYTRVDLIYADTNNEILYLEGEEVIIGNPAIEPTLPANTIKVAAVFVTGTSIEPPIPDLSMYLTKVEGDQLYVKLNTALPQTGDVKINGTIDVTSITALDFILNSPTEYLNNFNVVAIQDAKLGFVQFSSLPFPTLFPTSGSGAPQNGYVWLNGQAGAFRVGLGGGMTGALEATGSDFMIFSTSGTRIQGNANDKPNDTDTVISIGVLTDNAIVVQKNNKVKLSSVPNTSTSDYKILTRDITTGEIKTIDGKTSITGNQTGITQGTLQGTLSTPYLTTSTLWVASYVLGSDTVSIPQSMLQNGILYGFPDPSANTFTFQITYL